MPSNEFLFVFLSLCYNFVCLFLCALSYFSLSGLFFGQLMLLNFEFTEMKYFDPWNDLFLKQHIFFQGLLVFVISCRLRSSSLQMSLFCVFEVRLCEAFLIITEIWLGR